MTTLARLLPWIPTEYMGKSEREFEQQLIPLLKKHGLIDPTPSDCAPVWVVFSAVHRKLPVVEYAFSVMPVERDLNYSEPVSVDIQVVASDVTVVILGETGMGKALAARMVHGLSGRNEGRFI